MKSLQQRKKVIAGSKNFHKLCEFIMQIESKGGKMSHKKNKKEEENKAKICLKT